MKRVAAALVALVVSCSACSLTGRTVSDGVTARPSSSGADASASASTSTSAAPSPQHAVLAVADLPTGWAVDNRPAEATQAPFPDCFRTVYNVAADARHHATAAFVKGSLPSVTEAVGSVDSRDSPSAELDKARSTLDRCKDVTVRSGNITGRGTVGRMSFPVLGDDSATYDLSLTAAGLSVDLYLTVLRRGPLLAVLVYTGLRGTGLTEYQAVATSAAADLA